MALKNYPIHDEQSFVTAEMQAAIDWRRNIEELWYLAEEGAVLQCTVAPLARALGYGNSRDYISSNDDTIDYWGAIDTLLLLVLAAEGEELPS